MSFFSGSIAISPGRETTRADRLSVHEKAQGYAIIDNKYYSCDGCQNPDRRPYRGDCPATCPLHVDEKIVSAAQWLERKYRLNETDDEDCLTMMVNENHERNMWTKSNDENWPVRPVSQKTSRKKIGK